MNDYRQVIDALTEDAERFDQLIADLAPELWTLPTPAPGWTVTHQVGHLGFIFRIAGLSAADAQAFGTMVASLSGGFDAAVNGVLTDYIREPPEMLLARWRAERDTGIKALAAAPPETLVPWLVNPLRRPCSPAPA